jgi:hypothetical protein
MVRGNHPEISFEVRFVDNVSDLPGDKPWRMSKMIDKTSVPWDRKWHNVHIPLSEMKESGSWFNNTWFNPEGKFDWSAVDRFQISIERTGTFMQNIWFDNICITDQDTARVMEIGALGINDKVHPESLQAKAWPNPATEKVSVVYTLTWECDVNISILSVTGETKKSFKNQCQLPGDQTVEWDLTDDTGNIVPDGFYLFVIKTPWSITTSKILKL